MPHPLCFTPEQLMQSAAVLVLIGDTSWSDARAALTGCAADAGFSVQHTALLSSPAGQRQAEALALGVPPGGTAALDALLPALQALADEHAVDICWRSASAFGRLPQLAVFDMDSTLIQAEVIDELARAAGCWEQVSAVTERAMRGELDFCASFRERMATLRGLSLQAVEGVAARIALSPGATALLATLRAAGCRTAIVSGGFDVFARRVQAQLGIDEVHANCLHSHDGVLSGEVHGRIIDGQRKREILCSLRERWAAAPEAVLAVGDGANDLPMLGAAGMGVAYRAKPVVRAAARYCINHGALDSLLFMLGIAEQHWQHQHPPQAGC